MTRHLHPLRRTITNRDGSTSQAAYIDRYEVVVDGVALADISGSDLYGWNIVESASTFDASRRFWRTGLDRIGMVGRWFPRNADKVELARVIADAHAAARLTDRAFAERTAA